ncbi:MAG: hypothetical protein M3Y53_01495 [Thermoproteota archaeon]|nr:hypothetical protein [Thermoproteota archaeon]
MTELENAMQKHMARIICEQHRPRCKDFLNFEVDGRNHTMPSGTFRISKLWKGKVEPV